MNVLVIFIPNIKIDLLKKPFYYFTLKDAFKLRKFKIFIFTEIKNIKLYNLKNKKNIKIFFIKKKSIIKKIIKKKIKLIDQEIIVLFNAAYPYRNIENLNNIINKFKKSKKIILKSLSVANENPYKMWYRKNKKFSVVIKHKHIKDSHSVPRQLLPKTFIEDESISLVRTSFFYKSIEKKDIFFNIIKHPSYFLSNRTFRDIEDLLKNKINNFSDRLPS